MEDNKTREIFVRVEKKNFERLLKKEKELFRIKEKLDLIQCYIQNGTSILKKEKVPRNKDLEIASKSLGNLIKKLEK